jgi:N-hydroxyarylamine O-acetyltransferase
VAAPVQIDLDAYFARIGIAPPAGRDAAALETVQRAQRFAIPFENLDILLGRGISLSPDAVFDKLVTRRRGGYCFELNQIFLRALTTMGFEARPLLSRVWIGATEPQPHTHTLNLVTLDGREWIADAGFGGGYAPPMPLAASDPIVSSDGVRHRLVDGTPHGWMLERDAGSGWQPQYSFTTAPVFTQDLEAGNHWTATRPGTHFTIVRVVSRPDASGFSSIVDTRHTRHAAGTVTEAQIVSADEWRRLAAQSCGLSLSADEVQALGLFPGE